MNKLEVIQTLCERNGLSKAETTRIVSIFFEQMSAALEKGTVWRSVACVLFTLRIIQAIPGEILRQVQR
jgi:ABC-type nitrate/sulfonate/bicarbonate transport system substrate-binding protein